MKLIRRAILAALSLGAVLPAAISAADRSSINGIAAIANTAIITRQEVDDLARPSIDSLARALLRSNPSLFERRAVEAWTDALDHLIERQLILDDFKNSGFVLPEKWIDEQIHDIIRNKYGDRVSLGKSLQAEGLTFAAFRERQRDNLIISAMESRNVREVLFISPAKIENYYLTNRPAYQLEDQVKLRVISIDSAAVGASEEARRLALEIRRKVDGGADFAQMAAVNAIPPSRNGGDWGWHQRSKMSRIFSDLVEGVAAGRHGGLAGEAVHDSETTWIYHYDDQGRIRKARKYSKSAGNETFLEEKALDGDSTQAAALPEPRKFYLVKVEERKQAHVRPLSEVRDEIEKELIAQERTRLRNQWIEKLKAKSFVRRY
ncbi:MAG: Parvulin-like peptidyl-prolyl isomerase [Verrucomicrobiota bacterium]|jgi:peptidyl-prolyl cis-trans isomerase SurA